MSPVTYTVLWHCDGLPVQLYPVGQIRVVLVPGVAQVHNMPPEIKSNSSSVNSSSKFWSVLLSRSDESGTGSHVTGILLFIVISLFA